MYLRGNWKNTETITGHKFTCGHCGTFVGPTNGYVCSEKRQNFEDEVNGYIFVCPVCNYPTIVVPSYLGRQYPNVKYGETLKHLPEDVEDLYEEARACVSANAYTASVIVCRKILMNTAVSKGAEAGKSFASYVRYLKDNNYIPPQSEDWVDHIRYKGNEANHEIASMAREDAEELLIFIQILLTNVYVMHGMMAKHIKK